MTKPWEMDWKQAPATKDSAKPWEMDWKQSSDPAAPEHTWAEAPGQLLRAVKDPVSTVKRLAGDAVDAVKHIPSDAQNFAGGVAQAIIHPVKTVQGLNDAINGFVLRALPKNAQWLATYDLLSRHNFDDPETVQRITDTANALGGMYKAKYGSLNALEHTIRTEPVGSAADLSSILTAGAGVARSGAIAAAKVTKTAGAANTAAKVAKAANVIEKAGDAINPMTANVLLGGGLRKVGNALASAGAPSPITNTLGATGHTVEWLGPQKPMEAMAKGAVKVTGAAMNAANPKAKAWLTAVEGQGQDVVDRAKDLMKKGEVEVVPGSKPTIAEAVSDIKLTKLSQFDQAAKKHLSTEAARRQMANETAQMEHIGKVAKTEADVKAAETRRNTRTDPLYDIAKRQTVDGDPDLMEIINRPSMDEVMARAARIAKEENKPFAVGQNMPAHTTASTVLGPNGKPVMVNVPAQFARYKGEILHYIKMGFDDLINDPVKFPPGIKSKELNAIRNTRQEFLNWMEQKSKIPEYGTARRAYFQMSKPIDRMAVGQYLKDKLAPVHGEDAAALRSTTYENALKDAPRVAREATGREAEKLDEILTPKEMVIVNQVRDDLRRQKLNERLAKYGRGNDPDIKTMATDAVGNAASPSYLHPVVTTANALLHGLKGKFDQRLAIRVATELMAEDLNVPVAAIEKALAHEANVSKTVRNVEKVGKDIGKALRTPAVYNALSPNSERQKTNALSN